MQGTLLGRRSFLVAGVTMGLIGCTAEQTDTIDEVDFDHPLAVPPLADSRLEAGRRVFELTTSAGRSTFLERRPTATWGFNGPYLGPTLRARRGDEVAIHVRNGLDETTSVHWHGMHLPAHADGGPHQPIEPGATWSPEWRIDQPAATLWYHPHPHGETEKHVHRGLAGMFIVDDEVESALELPRAYGVDDIPVIVQDRSFEEDGSFTEGERREIGMLGDTLLVNGTVGPYLDATTERVRLRLLNASTARSYRFGFSDDRPFDLIATDGGLLADAYETPRVQLSPGERAEIVVTVSPGERVILRSYPPELGTNGSMTRNSGGEDSFDVMQLRARSRLSPAPVPPRHLTAVEPLADFDAPTNREFVLKSRKINGKKMDMGRIDEVVTVDTTEVWEVTNDHSQPHNFHVHDVQFRVLDIEGDEPPGHLSGWKDTVYVPPKSSLRIALRFADYADPNVPYMYHCHLLFHEDKGMMGQFVVVADGEQPAASAHRGVSH